MSEYTREEILKLIEENGGPRGLDLSGKDLSFIHLGKETIAAELARAQKTAPDMIPAWFSEETGGINLQGANLEESDLQSAELDDANLQEAHLACAFLSRAFLLGANLQDANLIGACLETANLITANLQGAILIQAYLQYADLWGANLQGANLMFTDLREVDLGSANLGGADLTEAKLQKARLWGANLQAAILADSKLQDTVMWKANLEQADLYNAGLKNTLFRRDESLGGQIKQEKEERWREAKEVYLMLKNNFKSIGRYDDASWAYVKERRMEKLAALKKAKDAWQKYDWEIAIPHYAKVAGDQLVEWVCDYGEGLGRVAGSLIAVWVAFALIYGLIAGVWGPWQDIGSGKIRYITRNPIDLLSFSLQSITTFAPIELESRPMLAMRILMPLEALLSTFLAGLLGFVAGKRIRRS